MKQLLKTLLVLCSLSLVVLVAMGSMNMGIYIGVILLEYVLVLYMNADFRKATKHFFIRKGAFGSENKYYQSVHLESLQADIEQMSEAGFEHFVADLFAAKGYKTMVTDKTREFGGSIVAKKDKAVSIIQATHCDKQGEMVDHEVVAKIVAAMPIYKASQSIIVTNGCFTDQAVIQAGYTKTALIDSVQLTNMVKEVMIMGLDKSLTDAMPVVLEGMHEVKLESEKEQESGSASEAEVESDALKDKLINQSGKKNAKEQ